MPSQPPASLLIDIDGLFKERIASFQTLKQQVREEIQDINLHAKRRREDARRRIEASH